MNVRASTSHDAVATLGALIGVGLGPGDPELVTVKAARLIGAANVVAFFAKRGRASHARAIAAPYLAPGCEEIALLYPVTTEIPFDQPEYV
ncbi:MAG TPA: SAM-dependent methyltransferase, partial [Methylocystis sp.]